MDFFLQIFIFSRIGIVVIPLKHLINYDLISFNI